MEIFYYITMGWIALFLLSYIWWGRSKSSDMVDAVFLVLLAIGVCYAFFLVGYGLGVGELISAILQLVMMAIVVFASFKFSKYNVDRRRKLIDNLSA